MGNEQLHVLAREVSSTPESDASVHWQRREAVRAPMRIRVQSIFRRCGYPPDLQDTAVYTVQRRTGALSEAKSTSADGLVEAKMPRPNVR